MSTKKRIFIAEDDPDYIIQMKIFIKSLGYSVITARDEKSALQIIEEENFDLAILDLMMDNQDSGFVLSYRIKRKNSKIPVIIVTAVAKETGYRFDINGSANNQWIKADAILHKNIRYEQLKREIDRLLV